jgi:hypothetical protein
MLIAILPDTPVYENWKFPFTDEDKVALKKELRFYEFDVSYN